MATKLKNLKIKKVDFVDEGANPDAHIGMVKRKNGEGQITEGKNKKESGNILKKLFDFIGKAAGMDESEINNAIDEIKKGDSISFKEKINEVNNRKICDEMWDICYALQSSLCSIINDEEMDSTSAAAAMQESLDEFYEVVKESIAKWSSGKSANIVKKSEDVSEADIEIMKQAVDRLNGQIEKAAVENDKTTEDTTDKEDEDDDNNIEDKKGEKKEMGLKIDKSKLTDAERAFYESIEKRYGTEEDDISVSQQEAAAGQTQDVQTSAELTVVKSAAQEIPTKVPEQQTSAEDEIYKGLHPAVRTELEELKKFREQTEERELTEIAKKYAIIGKKEEDLIPLFKSLKAAGGTAYNDMIAVLDQAVDTVEKSGVFSEIGKSGHGGNAGGHAWAEAEAKATEIMKSKAGLSKEQALDEVFMANPELAERCEKED